MRQKLSFLAIRLDTMFGEHQTLHITTNTPSHQLLKPSAAENEWSTDAFSFLDFNMSELSLLTTLDSILYLILITPKSVWTRSLN